jgi:small subunit ribosomal protein S2
MVTIKEAKKAKIKITGITNTDGDPKLLDFPIPASDSSKKSIELILETIKNSVKK